MSQAGIIIAVATAEGDKAIFSKSRVFPPYKGANRGDFAQF